MTVNDHAVKRKVTSRTRFACLILLTCSLAYVIAYAFNSAAGGYWAIPTRDGKTDRLLGIVPLTTAIVWQPAYGRWMTERSDWLGWIQSPLISVDRKYIHKTHYLGRDADWFAALTVDKVHPKHRQLFLTTDVIERKGAAQEK